VPGVAFVLLGSQSARIGRGAGPQALMRAGVRTGMDLRGKKVATSLNSSTLKTLQSVGLSEPDVSRAHRKAGTARGG
jgi:hypothetical protein